MAARSEAATESTERTLVITRIFDAPRSLVWQAWTDPERLACWLGPKGFMGKVIKMDVRAGGSYHYYMRGPQNDDHWLVGVYHEIVEFERLSYTYAWADAQGRADSPRDDPDADFRGAGQQDQADAASIPVRIGDGARCASGRLEQLARAPRRIPRGEMNEGAERSGLGRSK